MTQKQQLQTTHVTHSRGRLPAWIAWLILISAALTACADDATERRFANEPLPTVDLANLQPTATPFAATPVPAGEPGPALVSPQALLDARGAPESFYVRAGTALLAFPSDGVTPVVVLDDSDAEVRDYASSPSGNQVAVLLDEAGTHQIAVFDVTGDEVARFDDLDRLLAGTATTPAAAQAAGRDLISWSPQGDKLLAAFATGGILSIPLEGEPVALLPADRAPGPTAAAWSPAGDAIAFVNRPTVESNAGLYFARTDELPLALEALVRPSETSSASVIDMAWHPTGRTVLYTRSAPSGSLPIGGDLFQIAATGGMPTIVASAGRAAPISAIAAFAVSPDGRAVAYTVVVPGADGGVFHSLWLQQIGASNVERLAMPTDAAATDLWWTASGLVWKTVPGRSVIESDASEAFTLFLASSNGEVQPVYEVPAAATPEASPAGSGEGSPEPGAATPAAAER